MPFSPQVHRTIYYVGLIILITGLPLSKALMSVGQIVLLINWLWEGELRNKLLQFWKNKAAVLIASIFALHLIGLIHTDDWNDALNDLRVKLPLVILPLIMASSPSLSRRWFRRMLNLFIVAVFCGTLVSLAVYLGMLRTPLSDIRDLSILISHIRFSLLICIATLILAPIILSAETTPRSRIIASALALWFFGSLVLLHSITGMITLTVAAVCWMACYLIRGAQGAGRTAAIMGTIILPLTICGYFWKQAHEFYDIDPKEDQLEIQTPHGSYYSHDLDNNQLENGHYIWRNVSRIELEKSWNKISELQYDGKDHKGQDLYSTLIRYLASMGLNKDRTGVEKLTEADIAAIENGIANYRFMDNNGFDLRVYRIIWEFDNYLNGENPMGNSVTQRLMFWKAAVTVIVQNPVVGVGTGDLKIALQDVYSKMKFTDDPKYWRKPHNQFLNIGVITGLLGLCWFVVAVGMPGFFAGRGFDYFYFTFFVIALLSMLTEDTLGTQAGVTFYTFFSCFFLFGRED